MTASNFANNQAILELTLPETGIRQGGRAVAFGSWAVLGLTLLAVAAFASSGDQGKPTIRFPLVAVQGVSSMTVDDKAQIVVEGEDAQFQNTQIPLSDAPLETAKGFVLGALVAAEMPTALKCLTQAVYYEAAFEPLSGRRAVAQVVLNRMRHPAYPKSVCGVVYQGSERRTGCQFSFTCDGALLRAPAAGPWREAEAVARAALSGYVEPVVGTATHYHADYVLPKWAFTLAKIDQIGRHIFYRFNGNSGRTGAFSGRYAGVEHIPSLNLLALRERLGENGEGLAGLGELTTPGLTVAPHVTDRHATNDVGGRIDVTKVWRLNIPDPVAASSKYRAVVDDKAGLAEAGTMSAEVAVADDGIAVKQP